jgi:hypothetical protein
MNTATLLDHSEPGRGTLPAMKQVAIRFEESTLEELERIAKREDRTVSYIVRRFVREGLEREKPSRPAKSTK